MYTSTLPRTIYIILVVFVAFFPCLMNAQQPTDYAQPYIGTFGSGGVFLGAVVPWGMVSVSPHSQQRPDGLYDFLGLGHVHISGAGCSGLGHIVFMPNTGTLNVTPATYKLPYKVWNTAAKAGFVSVYIEEIDVEVDATTTTHASISTFRFPKHDGDARILIDASAGYSHSTNAYIEFISPTEIRGWNSSTGFCGSKVRRTVHFYSRVDKEPISFGTWKKGVAFPSANKQLGDSVGAYINFATDEREKITIKTGISYVSMENAKLNLDTEIPDWDFSVVRAQASATWNTELSKISVSTNNEQIKTKFYTALYHSLIHPNVYSDVNGEYPSMHDYSTQIAQGYTRYTLFSLWDTYRTVHPLLTLAYPERQLDMVRTMVEQYRESGWLPQWELPGGESHAMFGDPSGLVMTDTYAKGLTKFDMQTALEGMKKNALVAQDNMVRRGLDVYLREGFIPMDDRGTPWALTPVASTLEYAYSDWAASQAAIDLCSLYDWQTLYKNSQNFINLFDTSTTFFRPRNKDKTWLTPFDPTQRSGGDFPDIPESGGPGFAEGSAWHYLFYVLHDMPKLMELLGGNEAFITKLHTFFQENYFMWNEHNFANPYLFTYVNGEGWRTQKLVRKLMEDFTISNTGIPGNDDLGALSAWYVFSSMGFYPTEVGRPEYRMGSPLFDTVSLYPSPVYYSGKPFTIVAHNNTNDNIFIERSTLNNKPYNAYNLSHKAITSGGTMHVFMGPTASTSVLASYTPSLVAPKQHTEITLQVFPLLQWQQHTDARQTRLLIKTMQTEKDCITVLDTILPLPITQFRPSLLLQPQTIYAWQVQSIFDGDTSAWSPTHIFITATSLDIAEPPLLASSIDIFPSVATAGEKIRIRYRHTTSAPVRITMVDLLGKEHDIVPTALSQAGEYEVQWTPAQHQSGIFFIKFSLADTTLVKKCILTP